MNCTVENDVPELKCIGEIFLGSGSGIGIVPTLLSFAVIGLFITLVIGGFKYINSGGEPQSLAAAKATITYAILGIILIACSYLILFFIEEITGATVTDFRVYIN